MASIYRVRKSAIHGKGVFTVRPIKKGTTLPCLPFRGQGFNHSCDYNVSRSGSTEWISNRNIKEGEELTVWYGQPRYLNYNNCNCPRCKENKWARQCIAYQIAPLLSIGVFTFVLGTRWLSPLPQPLIPDWLVSILVYNSLPMTNSNTIGNWIGMSHACCPRRWPIHKLIAIGK